jgi:hypothetical protein
MASFLKKLGYTRITSTKNTSSNPIKETIIHRDGYTYINYKNNLNDFLLKEILGETIIKNNKKIKNMKSSKKYDFNN